MPCVGPTPDETRDFERSTNKREIGKEWDDHQLAVNVACALWRVVKDYPHRVLTLDPWVVKWGQRHDKQDEERKARDARDAKREAKRQRALAKLTDADKRWLGLE